jgi:KTSC domain-containing protein
VKASLTLASSKKEDGMEMILVRSRAIRAVGYDARTMQMRIRFQQGHTYDFCRVPADIYQGLMDATSKGAYYNEYIRDKYPC